MKKGVVWLLTEEDINEIYCICLLHTLAAKADGKEVNPPEIAQKSLEYLREHCTTDY